MDGKLTHRPKTFMGVQDSIMPFSSSNLSNNGEFRTTEKSEYVLQLRHYSIFSSYLEF